MMVVVYLRLETPANLGSSEWARLIWCRRLAALAVAGVSSIDGGGFGVAGIVRWGQRSTSARPEAMTFGFSTCLGWNESNLDP